ncbi:hypothetical protein QFC21_001127 [Naganishia friedmannii]|uniref:Uncharacterized protein n=1 Tax=Naganishia friedmannii TaxID=89922 RepID=A0ACC2W9A9_9TREE|nr:hypothetical protein QFC21_001127 [Naganishia friedmannii]
MSLSVSLRPLPTLNACQSVPIQWTYAGSAEGQLKLVFVSAQQQQSTSAPVLKASTTSVVSSITTVSPPSSTAAAPVTSPSVSRTSSISTLASPSSTRIATVAFPPTTTSRTPATTLARRAVTTSSAFTKTVTTVPLSVSSFGYAPIALPTGTYDLSAYLVPVSAGGTEQVVGSLKGVQVVVGLDNSCLSSTSGVQPSTSSTGVTTTNASPSTTGVASGANSGSTASTKGSSSNKGSIIGGVVGGVLGLALLTLLLYFCIIRPRKRRNGHRQSPLRPATSERKLGNWFTRRRGAEEQGTRGVGSAFGWDFGTLGSSTGVASTASRPGQGEGVEYPMVSSVSGPISATHVQGFQGYGNPLQRNENTAALYGDLSLPERPGAGGMIPPTRAAHPASHFDDGTNYADKDPEKANPFGGTGIEMLPVIPRNNSGQTMGSGHITSPHSERDFALAAAERDHFPEQEILNSASPSPIYYDASPYEKELGQDNAAGANNAPSSQGHDNSFSESSHMSGNSHAHLLNYSRSPVSGPLDARRASAVLPDEMGVQRRPSASANSISQRRKSGVVGVAGVERSTSVRRKPVPVVDVYEEELVGDTGPQAGGREMKKSAAILGGQGQVSGEPQRLKKQKSFVLDVDRPLTQ